MRGGSFNVLLCLGVFSLIVLMSRLNMVMRSCCVMSSSREMSFSGRVRDRCHDGILSDRCDGL
jgi:hypothetical protein